MKDQLTPLKETGIYISEIPANGTPLNIKYPDNLIQIDKEFYEILGTITSDIISFDPAPYLEKGKILYQTYRNYNRTDVEEYSFATAAASFRSLLNSCGYYWSNPCIHPVYAKPESFEHYEKLKEGWQSLENNLVTGILLPLIKK